MSSRFTILVFPNGRALLTTPDRLDEAGVARVNRAFRNWRESEAAFAVLAETEVVRVEEIELDLDRVEQITPLSINRAAFGLDKPDAG